MKLTSLLLAAAAALGGTGTEMRQPLFVIERNTNANVVHYDANLAPNGDIDPYRPVQAYWVMAAKDGRREELTALERSKAYGFTVQPEPDSHSYRMELVAQKGRAIQVRREGDAVRAATLIDGHRAYLTRIYVTAHHMLPTVKSIDLFGVDAVNGQTVHERVNP